LESLVPVLLMTRISGSRHCHLNMVRRIIIP
jgi:hypothetical protein